MNSHLLRLSSHHLLRVSSHHLLRVSSHHLLRVSTDQASIPVAAILLLGHNGLLLNVDLLVGEPVLVDQQSVDILNSHMLVY